MSKLIKYYRFLLTRLFMGWLVLSTVVQAHELKFVRSDMTVDNHGWFAVIQLEAWNLYPDEGPQPPVERGKEEFGGKEWISRLTADEFATMRESGIVYMNDAYQVMLNGERQSFAVEYLDFEKASPQWNFTETGQAVFRIKIHGTWKPGDKGPLSMQWVDYTDEPLALQLHTRNAQNEEQLSVLKVTSGERVDLAVIDATGKVSETQSTSLWAWIVAGFEHIIPKGVDHILFILGLFLLQPKIRPLLWQTTAFTIAHSITLALAVLGVLSVSSRIVEPAIALSIAYVGIENIWVKELKPWRVSLVFCLGLLHGMGFASVMQELEIPKGSVIKPLLGFNLGVEGGQIAVLSVAFLLTFALLKKPSFRWVRLVGSVLIGIMGLYWTVDRIIG